MKKKRFYSNKKRNKKWTEEEKGRKISFADKYIDGGNGSDKFDNRRPTQKKKLLSRDNLLTFAKYAIVTVCSFAVISIGYMLMDVYIDRNAMPLTDDDYEQSIGVSDIDIQFKADVIEPLSLDNSVMLSAVISEIQQQDYTASVFDLKRNDGTIGYQSTLATIDTYGAISSPAGDIAGSVRQLGENDILPIGRISCYVDNIAPLSDLTTALYDGGALYRDSSGNTYLNPDSESAYNYIKGIIEESKGNGISVFLLDNCNLPAEISAGHNDGFEALSEKLYKDFGDEIKLIECINISINAEDTKAIEEEWQEKTENINDLDIVFYVSAKDKAEVKRILDNKGIRSYIISG